MTATTTHHGTWKQSRVRLTETEWATYRPYLVAEREAGRVAGWTTLPMRRGVLVIVTHV